MGLPALDERLEIQKEFLGKHGMGPFCLALGPNACPLDQLLDGSHSSRKGLLAGRQPKDTKRYLRISIKQALQAWR
jgi:hypothetical protein